jgi:site-specific recombinase XerD
VAKANFQPMRGVFEKPKGSGIWWINIEVDGERHREMVGSYKVACEAYLQRRKELREGRYIPPKKSKSGDGLKFGALVDEVLADMKTRTSDVHYNEKRIEWGKLQRYSLAAKRFLPEKAAAADSLAELPAAAVTAATIQGILQALREEGSEGVTANKYRAFLGTVFSYAMQFDKLQVNPVLKVKKFKEPKGRVRMLSVDEEAIVRAWIQEHCPEREAEFDLALYSGARRGEQFRLTRRNVDFERGVILVDGKAGEREIELSSAAAEAVRRLMDPKRETLIAEYRPDRGRQTDWRRWFQKCIKETGIQDFHWHDLRHTFASRIVMATGDLRTVQELLGHKDIRMTMRYAHLTKNHRASAVETIVPTKAEKARRSGFRVVGGKKTGTA